MIHNSYLRFIIESANICKKTFDIKNYKIIRKNNKNIFFRNNSNNYGAHKLEFSS